MPEEPAGEVGHLLARGEDGREQEWEADHQYDGDE